MDDAVIGIVTAIASGAGGSVGTSGAAAIGRLTAALRAKFRGDPASRGALEIAVEEPGSRLAREDLAAALRARVSADAEFGQWLTSLWTEIASQLGTDASSQANVISGSVTGNVVQARDIKGGIRFTD